MAYCGNCGNKLEDGENFCPKCGTPTNGESAVQQSNVLNSIQMRLKKMGCWQKGLIIFLALSFIGFLSEKCDGGGSKTDEAAAPQVTEKAETQQSTNEVVNDDTLATEKTEAQIMEENVNTEEQEKKLRMMKIADMAYQKGYDKRKSTRELISSEEAAYQDYILRYNEVPNEGADPERWELFKKEYMRGFAQAAQDMLKDAY